VSKKTSASMNLNGDAEAAYAVLIDPGYVQEKNEKTGGSDVNVTVDGDVVKVTRNLPAPPIAQKISGPTIASDETTTWGPADADGNRTGTLVVDLGGKVKMNGTLTLAANGDTSSLTIDMDIKASVPFIGGKIEGDAIKQFERAVAAEEPIANAWLAK